MVGNVEAWKVFFTFSGERGPGLSSVWHAWNVTMGQIGGPQIPDGRLSLLAYGAFFLCCCAIFVLGVLCRDRPRVAQLTFLIVAQGVMNLLMVGGWFPVVGVPLPFISYGGTSLLVSLFSVGILINIGQHSQPAKQLVVSEPPAEERPRLHLVK